MSGATPGQAAYEAYRAAVMAPMPKWDELSHQAKLAWEAAAQAGYAAIAAQEPHAPELATLRADLADAEALLARWPKCPAGCNCRVGTEDADVNECGCDGPCTTGWEPQPAPELAAKLRETAANNIRLRDGIAELARTLDTSAAATRPSRKSDIESEIAIALRRLLEGQ